MTSTHDEEEEGPVRMRLRNRPSPRKSRTIAEMESPSTIFEKDEEMEAENDWTNHMSTEGVDQSIIELLNTTWDEERNHKKVIRSVQESTSHSTMTSCVSSFRDRKVSPETKCVMSQSTPNDGRGNIIKGTIKIKRPRGLKSHMIQSQTEAQHRPTSQINKSMVGAHRIRLSKSPSERVPSEFDAKTKKKCKSIKTDDSIAKFLERQKRASSKIEEADQKKVTKSIGQNDVTKYLSPRVCGSRSETSLASDRFRRQATYYSSDRLFPSTSNKLLIRRHAPVKKDRRVTNKDQRRTRACSPSIDLEPLRPRHHKSKRKTNIGQGPKKNLQITETSTYAISMDKLMSDQMLQLADSMQIVKSNMTSSKGSLTERTTDLSLYKLIDQSSNEISQSAMSARVDRETEHWSEGRISRRDSCTLRSHKPIVLSCGSSGGIPDLVIVRRSSERLSTGRISTRSSRDRVPSIDIMEREDISRRYSPSNDKVYNTSKRLSTGRLSTRSLKDRVRSFDTMEREDSSRRYSPSNDKVYNTLHSKSTSDRFRGNQVSGIVEEELNDSLSPSANRLRYQVRQSLTSVSVRSNHRRSPSIEEMRDRIQSRSTTGRFINRTSSTSNEVLSSKIRSTFTTDSSKFRHRTSSISTEQLKTKLHSNLTPERLTECSTGAFSTKQLKMIQNSKMLSKGTSEEYASCPSSEHLNHKECVSSNFSEYFKDSSCTSSEIQSEKKRSVSRTSLGVRIKRGSQFPTKLSSSNTRSPSNSSKLQSRRTPSTSTEKLRKSLRSGSRTSYRLQKRQSPSPISSQNADDQKFGSRTSAGVTHKRASIIASEHLKKQLRTSSSTTCQSNMSSEKPTSLTNSVSDKQIPCALVEQSKSRARSRISPRWTAENSPVYKVASAQIPPRTAMLKGTPKMSEGMLTSKMENLNVLWSKDGTDVGDGEEQTRRIREFLGIGCEHIDMPLAPAKPLVVIVKQRELGVQTHYAITDSIIPLASQSRGQFALEGPREKEVQTETGLQGLVVPKETDPPVIPKESFQLKHYPSAVWNFSLFILSTLWSCFFAPIFNLCLLILARSIVPTLWITIGIGSTMFAQYVSDQYEEAQYRKNSIGSLQIVKDFNILIDYVYLGVDYVFGGFLRISKPS